MGLAENDVRLVFAPIPASISVPSHFVLSIAMQLERLGPYRLGKKLGQGGMGAVYEGVDDQGQRAAIKVLAPQLAAEEGFRARFDAEIESLKKLHHPNIVRLYGYGEEAGSLFYAMELVTGTSLEDELRAGRRFEWREVTKLAIKLCRALKHAHDHGVIHRDIKPANLLLAESGEVKLSDFGIARLFGNTRMTSDGGVLGTAEYMAPEQADGRTVTDRCDQYSLGGVMYALLAGRPPFRAATFVEMLQLQRFGEPQPVRRYAPDTPAELDRIIGQLLQKDPQNRFVNTLLLARALEAMERGLSLSPQRDDFLVPTAEGASVSQAPIDSLAETADPAMIAAAQVPQGDINASNLLGLSGDSRPASTAPGNVRFTKVGQDSVEPAGWADQIKQALWSGPMLAALLCLAVVSGLAWALLRSPSADHLFQQFAAALEKSAPGTASEAEPTMRTFVDRFPDDDRTPRVAAYLEEAGDVRQQRRLAHSSRRLSTAGARSSVERAYSEAAALKATQPEAAMARFQAIANFYDLADASRGEREWVARARQEIELLEKQLEQAQQEDRRLIERQLAAARRLSGSDPAAARRIWQAIVELFGAKSWAADSVEKARQALAEANVTADNGVR